LSLGTVALYWIILLIITVLFGYLAMKRSRWREI